VMDMPNLPERWQAFGWRTSEVDGHSIPQLSEALSAAPDGRPHIILAHTVFGRGVSYMEAGQPLTQTHLPVHPINWHYLPMSDREFEIAMHELEASI
jgi:transketolase